MRELGEGVPRGQNIFQVIFRTGTVAWDVRVRRLILVFGAAVLFGSCLHDSEPKEKIEINPRYQITWLGGLPREDSADERSSALGINASGQVVGYVGRRFSSQAFLWDPANPDTLRELPSAGSSSNRALDINDLGQIVGFSGGDPVIWQGDSVVPLDIPMDTTLKPRTDAQGNTVFDTTITRKRNLFAATAINNQGVVVGYGAEQDPFDESLYDFIPLAWWQTDSAVIIYDEEAALHGINDNGQMSGLLMVNREPHVALWEDSGRTVSDLGFLEGATRGDLFATATTINENGDVAGYAVLHEPIRTPAEKITRSLLVSGGTITDLGSLSGGLNQNEAWGMNSQGQVVGFSYSGKGQRAVMWEGETTTDLNYQVLLGEGETLRVAYDINEAGVIVGEGKGPHGYFEAFILEPLLE